MKVIIPTDFSDNAYKAIAYVYDNFKHEELEIALIHSIKQPATSSGVMLRLDDLMMKDAERDMALLMSRIEEKYGDNPEVIIRHGYLKDWVEQVARVIAPDLIVMGTKGESDIASKLLGSVTESIIRTSKIPVLAIPASSQERPVSRVVISTAKDTLTSAPFIERFINHIHFAKGKLEVLRVLQSEHDKAPKSIKLELKEIPVSTIRNENIVDGINDYLAGSEVDILCLYHSHSTRLDYLFNRSVTKTICAKVQLPLLVMRG